MGCDLNQGSTVPEWWKRTLADGGGMDPGRGRTSEK